VDTRTERTAVVVDVCAGRLYLRSPELGEEWEAMPVHVRAATEAEQLSARVAELNHNSRARGW
jgi:hypothetical protein